MNNSQFRSLLSQSQSSKSPNGANSSTPSTRVPTLGSRARSSIPMTPRTVAGGGAHIDFRRQLSDLNEPPTKKFKSSGPKGVKLGKGYVDRAQALRTGEEHGGGENSKEEMLKNLEEMYKLQQIDEGVFEALRKELGVGGRVETSHLVKGLDWELLRRVKGGEDVLGAEGKEGEEEEGKGKGKGGEDVDVEDELDGVLSHEVQVKGKDEANVTATEIHGEADHPAAEVLSRDEILRRLKASRSAAAMPPPPPSAALNERFKKVGSDSKAEKKRFTEIVNGRRREVLLTTDEEGKSKRKVRWLDPPGTHTQVEEPAREVLGMEVPAEIAAKQKAALELQREEEEGDDDIFVGVGADYDPLAGIGSDEDEDAEEDDDGTAKTQPPALEEPKEKLEKPRNYFGDTTDSEKDTSHPIANDPTIFAALKRAAALRQAESASADKDATEEEEEDLDPERALKRKAFLEKLKQQQAADARDLDMGFGESRFGDEEDEDGPLYDGSGDEKKERRKRAPKKRKGDKDNVKDVLGVLEGRKGK